MMHDIFIPISDLNGAKNGIKAVAEITDWPAGAKNPIGRIKHILGNQGENDTEMNAILAEYGFPLSFPKEVENDAEEIPRDHPPKKLPNAAISGIRLPLLSTHLMPRILMMPYPSKSWITAITKLAYTLPMYRITSSPIRLWIKKLTNAAHLFIW
jgi:hypothetical protein